MDTFSGKDLQRLCDLLAAQDRDLQYVIQEYGYPSDRSRPNNFETLVRIIVGQQVNRAVADSVMAKLMQKVGKLTPQNVLQLSDQDFKQASFSRQKMAYIRDLSQRLLDGRLDLKNLEALPSDKVREQLIAVKGIGEWTVNIYLLMVLQRMDVFPIGDLAVATGLRRLKNLPKETSREELLKVAEAWRPYRSIAALLLWQFYTNN